MVADLTLQTAVERAGGAELTEKVTTASHGGSVAEAAATFPECFRYGRKSQSHVGNAVRSSQFEVSWLSWLSWLSKGGSHCAEEMS